MNTITINPTVIHVDSELQHIDIVNNSPVINVNSDYPANPIFETVTTTGDMIVGDDLDVADCVDIGDTLTVGEQINTPYLMVRDWAFFTDIDVSNNATFDNARFGGFQNNVSIDETGITLNGTATVWDDIQFPLLTAKLLGFSDPQLTKICDNGSGSTGIYAYSFSATQLNEVFLSHEMPHWYKEGSTLKLHLHMYPETNNDGNCIFDVEYVFNNIDAVLGNSTLQQITYNVPANSAKKHIYVPLCDVVGTGLKISHGIGIRIARRADLSGDTHNGAVWITRVAIHVEKDTLGSKTDIIK